MMWAIQLCRRLTWSKWYVLYIYEILLQQPIDFKYWVMSTTCLKHILVFEDVFFLQYKIKDVTWWDCLMNTYCALLRMGISYWNTKYFMHLFLKFRARTWWHIGVWRGALHHGSPVSHIAPFCTSGSTFSEKTSQRPASMLYGKHESKTATPKKKQWHKLISICEMKIVSYAIQQQEASEPLLQFRFHRLTDYMGWNVSRGCCWMCIGFFRFS